MKDGFRNNEEQQIQVTRTHAYHLLENLCKDTTVNSHVFIEVKQNLTDLLWKITESYCLLGLRTQVLLL